MFPPLPAPFFSAYFSPVKVPPPPLQPPWGGAISACNSRGRRKQTPRCSALTPRPKIETPKGTEIPPSWEGGSAGLGGGTGWAKKNHHHHCDCSQAGFGADKAAWQLGGISAQPRAPPRSAQTPPQPPQWGRTSRPDGATAAESCGHSGSTASSHRTPISPPPPILRHCRKIPTASKHPNLFYLYK